MTEERMFELIRRMVGRTVLSVDALKREGDDPTSIIDVDSCVVYDNGDYPFATLIGDAPSLSITTHMAWYGVAAYRVAPEHPVVFVHSAWGHTPEECIRRINRPDDNTTPNEELTELFKLLLTTYKL